MCRQRDGARKAAVRLSKPGRSRREHPGLFWGAILGGSWVDINGLISRVTILISQIRDL